MSDGGAPAGLGEGTRGLPLLAGAGAGLQGSLESPGLSQGHGGRCGGGRCGGGLGPACAQDSEGQGGDRSTGSSPRS